MADLNLMITSCSNVVFLVEIAQSTGCYNKKKEQLEQNLEDQVKDDWWI